MATRKRFLRQIYPFLIESRYADSLTDEISRPIDRLVDSLVRRMRSRSDSISRRFCDLVVAIESPRGSIRRWIDHDGTVGQTVMLFDYGYLVDYDGVDGEEIDVYLGPDAQSRIVFVVHQMRSPDFREYDEDKVMLGFASEAHARAAYLAQYDDPRFMGSVTTTSVENLLHRLRQRPAQRVRADEDSVTGLLARARDRRDRPYDPTVARFAGRVDVHQKAQLARQLGSLPDLVDRTVPNVIEGFVSDNVALVKSVSAELHAEIERAVLSGISASAPVDTIAQSLERIADLSRSKAKSLARDQVARLFSQLNVARQLALGITRFVWRDTGDERVRPLHVERRRISEREPYRYDSPPDGELPGQVHGCRCHPEPVIEPS